MLAAKVLLDNLSELSRRPFGQVRARVLLNALRSLDSNPSRGQTDDNLGGPGRFRTLPWNTGGFQILQLVSLSSRDSI